MKLEIFSVYDSIAKAFLPPFLMVNQAAAIRIFKACANSTDHQFGKFPTDYVLFHVGTFDDENARIESFQTCTNLGLAASFVEVIKHGETGEVVSTVVKPNPDRLVEFPADVII